MSSRSVTVLLAVVSAALLAGCRAGTSFHGSAEIGQWTPELEAKVFTGGVGDDHFDLVGNGGVVDDDALWMLDFSVRVGSASGRDVKAQTLNFGYWSHKYAGTNDLGVAGIKFAGQTLTGLTRTTASMNLYKFTYGEPQAGAGGANSRTEGTIGLHYFDFAVRASDGRTVAKYSGSAPMFVVGWKISYYDRAMVYYFNVEGMDLDWVALENVKGNVIDYSAGIRWSVGSNAALSLGYREYDASLDKRGETFKFKMSGVLFSLFIAW